MDRVDDNDDLGDSAALSLLQRGKRALARSGLLGKGKRAARQPVFEAGVDRVDRAELPDYNNNPPCMHGVNKPMPKGTLNTAWTARSCRTTTTTRPACTA